MTTSEITVATLNVLNLQLEEQLRARLNSDDFKDIDVLALQEAGIEDNLNTFVSTLVNFNMAVQQRGGEYNNLAFLVNKNDKWKYVDGSVKYTELPNNCLNARNDSERRYVMTVDFENNDNKIKI